MQAVGYLGWTGANGFTGHTKWRLFEDLKIAYSAIRKHRKESLDAPHVEWVLGVLFEGIEGLKVTDEPVVPDASRSTGFPPMGPEVP